MCRLLTGVLFLFPLAAVTVVAADPPADAKGGLQPGANLPGSFLPFNATGPFRGRFHCPIDDYGLEPVVMLFVRDLAPTDPVKELLKNLDERIDKNPAARLHAFVVFLSDELPDVLANNDKREELAKRVEDLASGLMLKNVVLTLDSNKDVEKYALGDSWATAILYSKFRVVAVHTLQKADAQAAAEKILADVGAKLKAAKTK
jgi:hypothetical protein